MKPIETRYKGYRFRSRLEARWAVFFDALGYRWEYEPEGFDLGDGIYYLPDFKVAGIWFEVKPSFSLSHEDRMKLGRFSHSIKTWTCDHPRCPQNDVLSPELFFGKPLPPIRPVRVWPCRERSEDLYLLDGVPSLTSYAAVHSDGSPDPSDRILWFYSNRGGIWYDPPENDSHLDGGAREHLERAIAAARSARFEHGERP